MSHSSKDKSQGSWGFYDDENNLTLEYITEIEKHILPDDLKKCKPEKQETTEDKLEKDIEELRKK